MKQIIFIALFLVISCEENQPVETVKDPNIYQHWFWFLFNSRAFYANFQYN